MRNLRTGTRAVVCAEEVFNASGLPYKELGLKDKLPRMGETEQFALLASDGMLVQRLILVGDDFVLVGFRESEWPAALDVKSNIKKGLSNKFPLILQGQSDDQVSKRDFLTSLIGKC